MEKNGILKPNFRTLILYFRSYVYREVIKLKSGH